MGKSKRSRSYSVSTSSTDSDHRRSTRRHKRKYRNKSKESRKNCNKRARKSRTSRLISHINAKSSTPPLPLPTTSHNHMLNICGRSPNEHVYPQNNFPVSCSVVPEFNPSDNYQTIESWINKVNECATIYSWNDKQICHYALPKLSGLAKKWFQGLPTLLFSWEQKNTKIKTSIPIK